MGAVQVFSSRAASCCYCAENPLNPPVQISRTSSEDARQTELIRKAWKHSGKVYGYRKLHDDLVDEGETFCPNGVARLTQLAEIKL
jgi:putative transposase